MGALPPGTLPEIQSEIAKLDAELNEARRDLAQAEAAIKTAEAAKGPAPSAGPPLVRDRKAQRQVEAAENRLLERARGRLQLDPAESIRKIIHAIQELNCPACTGGFVLMVAKVELKKWEAC